MSLGRKSHGLCRWWRTPCLVTGRGTLSRQGASSRPSRWNGSSCRVSTITQVAAPAPAPIPAGGCPGLTVNSSSWLLSCTLLAKPDGVQCLPPALSIFQVFSSQEPSFLCPPYLYAMPIQASNLYLLSHSESGHSVSHFLVARLSEPLAYVQ